MGHLSFFQAAYVGTGAICSTTASTGEEDTSAMSTVSRPQQEHQQQRRRRPNINNTSSKSMSFISVVALLFYTSAFAAAQDNTCNCSPIDYTFELKLNDGTTCPDRDPSTGLEESALAYFGPGVKDYTCKTETQIPTKITLAQFIPLNQELEPIGQTQTRTGLDLEDGGKLKMFTSPATNPPLVTAVTLKLQGVNESGNVIENIWTIKFTNKCGVLSLKNGTKFGWVIFVSHIIFDVN